jgi:hypothetical protein
MIGLGVGVQVGNGVGVIVGVRVGVKVGVGVIEIPSTLFVGAGICIGVGVGTIWVLFSVKDCLAKATKRRAAINNSVFFTPGMYSFAKQKSTNLTS